MGEIPDSMRFPARYYHWLWAALIAGTFALAAIANWYSFEVNIGYIAILYDIPIILACYAFARKGFAVSAGIAVFYLATALFRSGADTLLQIQVFIKFFVLIFLALIVTWLSEQLTEKGRLYEAIFETTGAGTMIVGEDTTVLLANRTMETVTGYSRTEVENKLHFVDFVVPEDRKQLVEYHQKRRENPAAAPAAYETRIRRGDGATRDLFTTVAMIPGTKKSVVSVIDITDRKQAQEALRRSEEKLRSTLQSMDDLVFALDRNGIFIDFYQPEREGLYIPPDQFIGKSYRDVLPPQVSLLVEHAIMQVKEDGVTRQIEYDLDLPTGKSWFSTKLSLRKDASGSFDGVTVVARDITARKRTIKALEASERRNRAIVKADPDAFFRLSGDGRILDAELSEYVTLPMQEFVGKNVREIVDSDLAERVFETIRKTFETDEPQVLSFSFIFSGAEHHYEGRFVSIAEDEVLVIITDITDKVRAVAEHAMLAAVVRSSDDAIILQDLDGIIKSWNRAAERMYRYTWKEMIGTPISRIIPPRIQAEMTAVYDRIRNGERVEQFDTVRLRKDGTEIEISFSISPLKDETGSVIGITTMAHDITRQREQERALLSFITETAMRLRHPMERVTTDIRDLAAQLDEGKISPAEARMALLIQVRNTEQITRNLIDLNRAIAEQIGDLPEAYRNYLSK